jgi:hypothetical protein
VTGETREHVLRRSFDAVRELALGPGVIQERLEGACDAILSLESKEVPESLRDEFMALITVIMGIEDLSSLNEEAAVALAQGILAFHESIVLHRSAGDEPVS